MKRRVKSYGKQTRTKRSGVAMFRKAFARHSHKDDWGVQCIYEYSAWRIWQAAIRHERKLRRAGT